MAGQFGVLSSIVGAFLLGGLPGGVAQFASTSEIRTTPAPVPASPAFNLSTPPITTTPVGVAEKNETNTTTGNETIVIENITVVNITQVNTEYVVSSSGSGGLDEELTRLVDAFKNPRQFFATADLDAVGIITFWGTSVFFIFFAIAIAVDRSRYKLKYQNNHNLLLLIALIASLNYLTMANGHGRAMHRIIKEVKPYNLTRYCEKNLTANASNVSAAPTPPAATGGTRARGGGVQARTRSRAGGAGVEWAEDGGRRQGQPQVTPVAPASADTGEEEAVEEAEVLCTDGIVK